MNADGGFEDNDSELEYAGHLVPPPGSVTGGGDAAALGSPGSWTHWLTLVGTGGEEGGD